MALDLYQPCPCHQQRKLKFCCGKDVVARISKAIELMEGEQRRKAMDYLDESIRKFGHKDCLSTMRFGAAMDSGDIVTATETADQYAEDNGPTSVGYSMQAILSLENDSINQAIDFLQSALESDDQLANLFEDALLTVIFRLLSQSDYPAARSHAYLFHQISVDKKDLALTVIKRCQLSDYPLVIKNEWPLVNPTAAQPWAKRAAQAIHWADKWQWRRALEQFQELAEENPGESSLWKNVAILAGHLNKKQITAQAWRNFAKCENVNQDHAEEAEQMAIVISNWDGFETEKIPDLTVDLTDYEQTFLQMERDPRFYNNQEQLPQLQKSRNPAIKACFRVYDRPIVTSINEVSSFQDLPLSVGVILLHGKTTDRSAHIEAIGQDDDSWYDLADELMTWETVDSSTKSSQDSSDAISPVIVEQADWIWHVPTDVDEDKSIELHEARWKWTVENKILPYQSSEFGGKTLQEAANDPAYKSRVAAVLDILSIDTQTNFDRKSGIEQVKETLGIPKKETLDPETVRLEDLSLGQFARLDFAKMPMDMLAWAFEVAGKVVNKDAIIAISNVIIEKLKENEQEVKATFPVHRIFQILAKLSPRISDVEKNLDLAIRHFPEDAPLATEADWIMGNFEVCVARRLFDRAVKLLQQASEVCRQDEELHLEFVKTCARLGIHPGSPLTSMKNEPQQSGLILDPSDVGGNESLAEGGRGSELWIPGQ